MSGNANLKLKEITLHQTEEWKNGASGVVFLFVHQGKGRFSAQDNSQVLGAGDVLVASSELKGTLHSLSTHGLKGSYFSAHLDQLLPLLTSREICHLDRLNTDFKGIRYLASESPLAKECISLSQCAPPIHGMEHRCHLLRIVAKLFGEYIKRRESEAKDYGPSRENMLGVLEQLSGDELQNLSVEELASRFNCSRRHLNRLFQEHFGTSVAALKMEMRLLKAAALLRDPSLKIVYVAMECGFSHLGMFSTSFKKRFGVNPSIWRKELHVASPGKSPAREAPKWPNCGMSSMGLCPWAKGHPPVIQSQP